MAISSAIKVEMVVDGQPLPEYSQPQDGSLPQKTIKCVVLTQGVAFGIRASVLNDALLESKDISYALTFRSTRKPLYSNLFSNEELKRCTLGKSYDIHRAYIPDEISGGEKSGHLLVSKMHSGTIEVGVFRVKNILKTTTSFSHSGFGTNPSLEISSSERIEPGQLVAIAGPTYQRAGTSITCEYLDQDTPFAMFEFRYSMNRAPTISSSSGIENLPLETLSLQDLSALARSLYVSFEPPSTIGRVTTLGDLLSTTVGSQKKVMSLLKSKKGFLEAAKSPNDPGPKDSTTSPKPITEPSSSGKPSSGAVVDGKVDQQGKDKGLASATADPAKAIQVRSEAASKDPPQPVTKQSSSIATSSEAVLGAKVGGQAKLKNKNLTAPCTETKGIRSKAEAASNNPPGMKGTNVMEAPEAEEGWEFVVPV
ncbi:MAG: hypothetical protein Q9181_007388 [Wetmoreana brouardii]